MQAFFHPLPFPDFYYGSINFGLIMAVQIVEPQSAEFFIHNRTELMPQHFRLRCIDNALKHGILNTLSVIDTLLCNLP